MDFSRFPYRHRAPDPSVGPPEAIFSAGGVGADYLETMGIRIVEGCGLERADLEIRL